MVRPTSVIVSSLLFLRVLKMMATLICSLDAIITTDMLPNDSDPTLSEIPIPTLNSLTNWGHCLITPSFDDP